MVVKGKQAEDFKKGFLIVDRIDMAIKGTARDC